MSFQMFLVVVIGVAIVALIGFFVASPRSSRAKYLPGDKVIVSSGAMTIHCSYWVEWGDDIWHVQIERVEEKPGAAAPRAQTPSEIVAEALRGSKRQRLLIEDNSPKEEPNQPPEPTR